MAFLREASHSFRESNAEYFSRLLQNLDDDPLLGGDIPEPEDDQSDQDEENDEVGITFDCKLVYNKDEILFTFLCW